MASAARRSTGNSLLRVSQACETLLAGFNSGQAAAVRSCLVSREHAVSVSERSSGGGIGTKATGTSSTPIELLLPVRGGAANAGVVVRPSSFKCPCDGWHMLSTSTINTLIFLSRPSLLVVSCAVMPGSERNRNASSSHYCCEQQYYSCYQHCCHAPSCEYKTHNATFYAWRQEEHDQRANDDVRTAAVTAVRGRQQQ